MRRRGQLIAGAIQITVVQYGTKLNGVTHYVIRIGPSQLLSRILVDDVNYRLVCTK